jgi:GT2 family glycosyltransferase
VDPLVSIIVLNWNGRKWLERCLGSLAAQTYAANEIILVDNGSTDDSVAWVARHFPAVQVIGNAENRGFAAACNQGARAARGVYLALLNNDAWAEPQWLAELVRALEGQPERVGMAASKMLFADRPQIINSTGICVDRSGISWDRLGGTLDNPAETPADVFGPCGGAALYRRVLFEELGGFDETFFAYLEDVDLAWRARWRGWQALYVPSARVYHAHSGTGKEGSAFKTFHLSKNKVFWIAKNYPWPHLLIWGPWLMFYEVLSQGFAVRMGQGVSALAGRLAGWRALPELLRQRRQIFRTARVSATELFGRLEPVAWPWQVIARYRSFQTLRSKEPPNIA